LLIQHSGCDKWHGFIRREDSFMRIRCLLCVFYFITSINVGSFCKIVSLNKKATLVNTIETKNCFVSYVLVNGKRYLIKQKKAENKQIAVVRDALAAFLAKSLNIAHKVDIISFKKKFPGKICAYWPATLHTIAPGETVRKQPNSIYSTLRLRQLWALAKNFDEMGLTRDMIRQMTWHKQLPIIMAMDLMFGNSDRHCGNLCYDPVSDKFCAIDMDDTFNKDLCIVACKKFEIMMQDPHDSFTIQEIHALMQLRKTIKYIINEHNAIDVVKKLYYFAHKAGFVSGNAIYTPSISKKLQLYESMIMQSWKSAHKLIAILNKIIDPFIKGYVECQEL